MEAHSVPFVGGEEVVQTNPCVPVLMAWAASDNSICLWLSSSKDLLKWICQNWWNLRKSQLVPPFRTLLFFQANLRKITTLMRPRSKWKHGALKVKGIKTYLRNNNLSSPEKCPICNWLTQNPKLRIFSSLFIFVDNCRRPNCCIQGLATELLETLQRYLNK